MIVSGIGPQSGASSIVGSDSLPSSPTTRQVYVVPGTGMFVCLSDGSWTQLDQSDAGTVSGSGVTNRLTKWIDGTGSVLGDSGVADDGTNVLCLRPFAVGYGLSTPAGLLAGPRITAASTISTSPRGILSAQYSSDTAGARVGFQKARGTIGTPTTVVTGDTLGRLMFRGYDGTNYLEMGSIEVASTGTIGTSQVPTTIVFSTATNANPSVLTTALTLGADQSATFAAGISSTTGTFSTLTSGRVPIVSTNGLLIDDSDMTFATDTLTVTKLVGGNLKISSNTRPQGFITFNGTDGLHLYDATNGGKGWEMSASQFVANALEFTPATTNGGTTYTTPVLSLLPGTVAMGKTVPTVIGAGATHGQSLSILQGEELLTIAASPTTATTMQIPANAVVLSVNVRVTTIIPTAATFTVTGTSSATAFNTAAVSTAATTTDVGTKSTPFYNATAQTITITPNLTPGAATGVVRVTCAYYLISPATS